MKVAGMEGDRYDIEREDVSYGIEREDDRDDIEREDVSYGIEREDDRDDIERKNCYLEDLAEDRPSQPFSLQDFPDQLAWETQSHSHRGHRNNSFGGLSKFRLLIGTNTILG